MKFYKFIVSFYLFIFPQVFANSSTPPNIILILTDEHGWTQLSTAMDKRYPEAHSKYLETPNINKIANGGMRFTQGYSSAPLCTPTRRNIQCGTSAARSGTEFKSSWVPAEHMTIPKALKSVHSSYQCAHFGKWGELMISTPEECGYDLSDGMTGNNTGGMEDKMKEGYVMEDPKRTESVTHRALQFMEQQVKDQKPFECQISYYAMYLRVEALEKTWQKYREKGQPDRAYSQAWAAMLEELDANIGKVLNKIEALKQEHNTYVIFTTDNGGRGIVPVGNSKSLAPNHPMTGAKHSLWEGGIRVPFLIKGPGIAAMSYQNTPVVGYDFLPTFYDLAGGSDRLPSEIDGGSFAPSSFSKVQKCNVPIPHFTFIDPKSLSP